jgi:hypothetical protein
LPLRPRRGGEQCDGQEQKRRAHGVPVPVEAGGKQLKLRLAGGLALEQQLGVGADACSQILIVGAGQQHRLHLAVRIDDLEQQPGSVRPPRRR